MKWVGIAIFLAVLLFAGIWVIAKLGRPRTPSHKSDDPRLTFDTIFRNVRPDVHYVGDEACIRCHRDAADAYHQHPMARSMAPIAQADRLEQLDTRAHNPFDALGFQYEVQQSDHGLVHAEKRVDSRGKVVSEIRSEVSLVVGSGIRGRSYLVDHDGFLFQSPISWYAGARVWDLAPSYRVRNQHFNRPIPDECIYCHANRADPVAGSLNHFRTPLFQGYAIGCERCHGPGELHVRRRENNDRVDGVDDTIVNPVRLDPELRESVCQQCHLQAVVRTVKRNRQREDFRPGLPLGQFVSFYVLPAGQVDTKRAVGHVEQMYASRCFQESGGKLGCLSCHDPHNYPAADERVKFYRERCLHCHTEKSCGLLPGVRRGRSPKDNCLECHMPREASSNIAHTAITDHRIVRLVGLEKRGYPKEKTPADEYPIVRFDDGGANSSSPDRQRDLGMALIDFASKEPSHKWGQLALPLLDAGLARWPDDVPAWEAKGYALMVQGRPEQALNAFATALGQAPDREKSLFGAALMAAQIGRSDDAVKYWTNALALNPWNWEYHDELAKVYAARRDWRPAAQQSEEALKLNQAIWETRKLLIRSLLRQGKKDRAEIEFKILLGFEPPDPEALRRWFDEEGRGG